MKTLVQLKLVLSVWFALLCSVSFAVAQYNAGIQGVITDSAGSLVPEAHVILTNQETALVHNATTNSNGVYTIVALAPGKYTLTVD